MHSSGTILGHEPVTRAQILALSSLLSANSVQAEPALRCDTLQQLAQALFH